MKTAIRILKAFNGDSILVRTFNADRKEFIILIDGGTSSTFDYYLRDELAKLKQIDLLILTHIDSDHISGLIKFFRSTLFNKINILSYWVNAKNLFRISTGTKISYNQGITFEELLLQLGENPKKINEIFTEKKTVVLSPGVIATILSPPRYILNKLYNNWPELHKSIYSEDYDIKISAEKKKDDSLPIAKVAELPFTPNRKVEDDLFNSSSIAFILETLDIKLLLLGDARPELVIKSLRDLGYSTEKKLKVDYVKVSHHGSKNNTSSELLDMIDCHNYIISTNGGAVQHKHPDRETIARIIFHPMRNLKEKNKIYLNYPYESFVARKKDFLLPDDFKTGNWELIDNIQTLPE